MSETVTIGETTWCGCTREEIPDGSRYRMHWPQTGTMRAVYSLVDCPRCSSTGRPRTASDVPTPAPTTQTPAFEPCLVRDPHEAQMCRLRLGHDGAHIRPGRAWFDEPTEGARKGSCGDVLKAHFGAYYCTLPPGDHEWHVDERTAKPDTNPVRWRLNPDVGAASEARGEPERCATTYALLGRCTLPVGHAEGWHFFVDASAPPGRCLSCEGPAVPGDTCCARCAAQAVPAPPWLLSLEVHVSNPLWPLQQLATAVRLPAAVEACRAAWAARTAGRGTVSWDWESRDYGDSLRLTFALGAFGHDVRVYPDAVEEDVDSAVQCAWEEYGIWLELDGGRR